MNLRLWGGLLVSTVGGVVALWAYTGPRTYNIVYVPVLVLGLAVLGFGAYLTGLGRGVTKSEEARKRAK